MGAGGRHKAVRVLLKGLKPEAMGLGRCPSVSSARRLFKCWNEVRLTLRLNIQVSKRCCLYLKLNLTLSLQGVRHKYFSVGGPPSVGVYRCPGYCGFLLDAHYPIPVVPLRLLLPRLGSPVRSPASPGASPSILSEAIATEQYGSSRTVSCRTVPLWNSPSPHSFVGPALIELPKILSKITLSNKERKEGTLDFKLLLLCILHKFLEQRHPKILVSYLTGRGRC